MKKIAIVCAIMLATTLSLVSCGDTNYCYEVTVTTKIAGLEQSVSYYWWGTKNDLKTYEQTLKDAQEKAGISGDAITITSKKTSRSQSDCIKSIL
ncbi:MAG: hypothetical protein ACI30A_03420 [Paludibacteraceae bacterium]